jgi:limonene 1,2-monooxygenase
MLGVGPGSLPTDGIMVGLSQSQTRGLLEDGLGVIMKLLRTDEPVTFRNDRWDLRDARLHLRPYSNPLFDITVPAVASPTGPKLAGMHGVGLLSIGATTAAGFDALALHWDVMEAQAAPLQDDGRPQQVAPRGPGALRRDDGPGVSRCRVRHRALVQLLPGRGGVPADGRAGQQRQGDDRLRQRIGLRRDRHARHGHRADRRLWQQSKGGFGAYLMLAHNWANFDATRRSYDLIARHVMPEFKLQSRSTLAAADRAEASRETLAAASSKAVDAMREKHEREVAARVKS